MLSPHQRVLRARSSEQRTVHMLSPHQRVLRARSSEQRTVHMLSPHQRVLRARSREQRQRRVSAAAAGQALDILPQPVQRWWNDTVDFWIALEIDGGTPLEKDEAEEAKALLAQLQAMNKTGAELSAARRASEMGRGGLWEAHQEQIQTKLAYLVQDLPGMLVAYYKMRAVRAFSRKAVKKGFVSSALFLQVAVAIIFLRVLAPRLLVAGNVDELSEAATAIGIPDKATLQAGLQELQNYGGGLVVGLYLLAFILEKLTMVSDVLPVQIGLKTIAPVLFGGLVPGALASATCETIAATCNFLIGKNFVTKRLEDFTAFDMRLGDASWFEALRNNAREDGFRLTLLLRLAPILPLPFDSYWYLLGALPVNTLEFMAAHFLGCLKTAFLDASFGVLLLSTIMGDASTTAVDGGAVQTQAQEILLLETIGFAVAATLVGTVATKLLNEMLGLEDDEDEDENDAVSKESVEKAEAGKVAAPAAPEPDDAKPPLEKAVSAVRARKAD